MLLALPAVLRQHDICDLLRALSNVNIGEPNGLLLLDALAELRHLREHLPHCVNRASTERDRRMEAETARDLAVRELALVRAAWVKSTEPAPVANPSTAVG